jgi:hypothetical protein
LGGIIVLFLGKATTPWKELKRVAFKKEHKRKYEKKKHTHFLETSMDNE